MHVQFAELPVFDQDRAKALHVDIFDRLIAADQSIGKAAGKNGSR